MSAPEGPRRLPLGEGDVPDKALEELLAAFSATEAPSAGEIDLDDPSIDALLGLTQPGSGPEPETAEPEATEPQAPEPEAPEPEAAAAEAPKPEAAGPEAGEPETAEVEVAEPVAAQSAAGQPEAGPPEPPARKPIQIGGDDLPDPVYLDEEAEERLRGTGRATEASVREERNTILIGGDEIEGSAGGIPVGTGSATMDPRLRARRIAVKRAIGRRRLKWVIIVTLVIVVVTAGLAVLGSSLFAVERSQIHVSGNARMDSGDLEDVIDELDGTPVLLVDTSALERQLERSPWVEAARITTDFPHGATIEIRERVPIATYLGTDSRWRILDVNGEVIDVIAGQPIEFMRIIGSGINAEPGDSAGAAFTRAAEVVQALSPAVRSRTASVNVGNDGELSLSFHPTTSSDGDSAGGGDGVSTEVVLGAPTELLDKLTRLEALLKNSDISGCSRVDVSTQEIGRQCPP